MMPSFSICSQLLLSISQFAWRESSRLRVCWWTTRFDMMLRLVVTRISGFERLRYIHELIQDIHINLTMACCDSDPLVLCRAGVPMTWRARQGIR